MFEVGQHLFIVSSVTLCEPLTAKQIELLIHNIHKTQQKTSSILAILLLDKDAVASPLHLKACIHFALKAFAQKTNIAKKIDAEIMLYLAGVRQIVKAIPKVGVSNETKELLFVQLFQKELTKQQSAFSSAFIDFQELLAEREIPFENFQRDLMTFQPGDYSKIIHSLQLEELLNIFSAKEHQQRATIIEKLAIEQSTLLELQK